jgi:signal transduction histidine kinase
VKIGEEDRVMKKKVSIKLRTAILLAVFGLCILFLTVFLAYEIGHALADNQVKATLKEDVEELAADIRSAKDLPTSVDEEDGMLIAVYSHEGELLLGQEPTGLSSLASQPKLNSKKLRSLDIGDEKYFLYDKKSDAGLEKSVYVRGFYQEAGQEEIFVAFQKVGLILLPFALLLYGLLGYLLAKRETDRLEALNEAASAIVSGKDLNRTLPSGKVQDELSELSDTINRMLSRLESSFENEKRFISDASHELRTPTAVILAQCDLMHEKEGQKLTISDYTEALTVINRQAERMKRLITELLEFSRLDKGCVEKKFETVDVSQLVSLVCQEQEEIHTDSDISLRYEAEPNVLAEANQMLLIRMLVNLIDNAYKYGKSGGHIDVSLRLTQKVDLRPLLVFTVEDDGIGISEADQKKIWERFYRVDSSRTDGGSSGLGLSMVKWIVGYHGGSIQLDSQIGKGSKFTIEIPVKQS